MADRTNVVAMPIEPERTMDAAEILEVTALRERMGQDAARIGDLLGRGAKAIVVDVHFHD